jgi:PII-like signaling protein
MKRLVVIVSESVQTRGRPLWRAVLDALHRHKLAGATATRGLLGFGHSGKLHEGLSPDAPPDLPVTIEAVDEGAAIDRALPDVDALVPDGFVAVHEVQVVKAKKHGQRESAVQHQKLTGKAKMLRIHIGANDTWEGEPLSDALVKRFHQLDLAGATVYRGTLGYGASGRIHKRAVFRSNDEPITVVTVDEAGKIEKALPYLDQMIGHGMVAISDVDVILYKG